MDRNTHYICTHLFLYIQMYFSYFSMNFAVFGTQNILCASYIIVHVASVLNTHLGIYKANTHVGNSYTVRTVCTCVRVCVYMYICMYIPQ